MFVFIWISIVHLKVSVELLLCVRDVVYATEQYNEAADVDITKYFNSINYIQRTYTTTSNFTHENH